MCKKVALTISSLIAASIFLTGCGKVLDYRNAEISNNKIYESGKNTPFSGKVTNFPVKNLPIEQLSHFARIVMKDTVDRENFLKPSAASALINGLGNDTVFCDLNFDNGIAEGKVLCNKPNSESTLIELNYRKGTIDGDVVFYNFVKDNEVLARAKYKNGLIDGESVINSFDTGKIIHKIRWANGLAQGAEEKFNKTTGALIQRSNADNGKLDGELIKYTEDGQIIIAKASYKEGVQEGIFEEFDPTTGKLFRKSIWKNGLGEYIQVSSDQSNIASIGSDEKVKAEECLNTWTMAYRKEAGNDVLVSTDQISEWEASCKEGKRPN